MQFKNLEDKCLYYRSLSDYKLLPNSYVLVMIDGRSFSHMVKNRFEKPFDDDFINMMNETAKEVCKQIQGCKLAYVQSDEISFLLTDFDTPTTDAFFGNRLCKLQSIIAAIATAKFNQLMLVYNMKKDASSIYNVHDAVEYIEKTPLYQFDCKAWNVPTQNDALAWFLYRQNDCIKNSKQQAAQTYLSHKELMNKHTDEQIEYLKIMKGIDWHDYDLGKKYGRFIWKEARQHTSDFGKGPVEYIRHEWIVHTLEEPLTDKKIREDFLKENIIPKLQ